jgi:hypothetical protein
MMTVVAKRGIAAEVTYIRSGPVGLRLTERGRCQRPKAPSIFGALFSSLGSSEHCLPMKLSVEMIHAVRHSSHVQHVVNRTLKVIQVRHRHRHRLTDRLGGLRDLQQRLELLLGVTARPPRLVRDRQSQPPKMRGPRYT